MLQTISRSVVTLLALAPLVFCADEFTVAARRKPPREPATISVESRLVLVPTTVMDRRGATVTGLSSDAFAVTQDNVPQNITSFEEQDVPVSISVVLDTSGSMEGTLRRAQEALRAFVELANPEDEAGLLTVSTRPSDDLGFTTNLNSLPGRLVLADAGGSTALVDTIYAALHQSRFARHGRKALLVISDGMDNHSRYSKAELMSAAIEAGVQIYCVSVYDPPLTRKPMELREEREGQFFLRELARRTGGIQVVAHGHADIEAVMADIGRAMRDQYLIGYVPDRVGRDGKWHPIKVTLKKAGTKAWARSGFYAH